MFLDLVPNKQNLRKQITNWLFLTCVNVNNDDKKIIIKKKKGEVDFMNETKKTRTTLPPKKQTIEFVRRKRI